MHLLLNFLLLFCQILQLIVSFKPINLPVSDLAHQLLVLLYMLNRGQVIKLLIQSAYR